jgi:hypothetical protein
MIHILFSEDGIFTDALTSLEAVIIKTNNSNKEMMIKVSPPCPCMILSIAPIMDAAKDTV